MRTSARDRPELELVIERPSRALRRARLPDWQPPDAPGTIGRRSVDPRHLRPAGAKGCRTQCVLARVYAGSRPAKDPSRHTFVWQVWELMRVACQPRTRPPTHSGGSRPCPAVRRQRETAALGTRTRLKILEMRPEIHGQRTWGRLASVDLASDPSPPYRNQRARQQVGHGVRGRRSACEAGAPRFPETARAAHCRQPWYGRSQVGIRKTAPGTFGTTLTSGHRAPPCTPRSMLGR